MSVRSCPSHADCWMLMSHENLSGRTACIRSDCAIASYAGCCMWVHLECLPCQGGPHLALAKQNPNLTNMNMRNGLAFHARGAPTDVLMNCTATALPSTLAAACTVAAVTHTVCKHSGMCDSFWVFVPRDYWYHFAGVQPSPGQTEGARIPLLDAGHSRPRPVTSLPYLCYHIK
jgi:hypothetical protein